MQEARVQPFILGPGGLIRNVDANKEILEEIQRTRLLPPIELLALANFYRGYETNTPLGDHLELIALRQIISVKTVHKTVVDANHPLADPPENSEVEDFWPPFGDLGLDDDTEPSDFTRVKQVTFSGVRLLVEIVYYETKSPKPRKRYYLIGVTS
jgi:hypothetical protein